MSMLTQPQAQHQIHGTVLSEWLSIRHYCFGQVQAMWLHISQNMNLSEEKRLFYITQAMYQLRQVCYQ